MIQRLGAAVIVAGFLLIGLCLYLIEPVLLLGAGGIVAVGVGNTISRLPE